jgi:hypothetical protein
VHTFWEWPHSGRKIFPLNFRSLTSPLQSAAPGMQTRTPRYFMSNLIASCAQPDTGGPFDEVSGR